LADRLHHGPELHFLGDEVSGETSQLDNEVAELPGRNAFGEHLGITRGKVRSFGEIRLPPGRKNRGDPDTVWTQLREKTA